MDKFSVLYIQKYSNKYKVTIEVDIQKACKLKGFYNIFILYEKYTKVLKKNELLIHKSSLQYNGKHLLQFQVKSLDSIYEFVSEYNRLFGTDIKFI